MPSIGLVHGRVRQEEKLLIDAANRRDVPIVAQHDDSLVLDSDGLVGDVILSRSVSATRGHYVQLAAAAAGRPCVNRAAVAATCADKAATSFRLRAARVPTPETLVAFTPDAMLDALDRMGYPAVVKPVQGSWARGIHRVRDRAEAEQLFELRGMLASPAQHILYAQSYVDKSGPDGHVDLRAFVVGDETIACIERRSPHWITNTARGATTSAGAVDEGLHDLCQRAADAVGGGVLAIDLMDTPDGLVVHEINHSMEFRNSIEPTGIDIPGRIIDHCVSEARQ